MSAIAERQTPSLSRSFPMSASTSPAAKVAGLVCPTKVANWRPRKLQCSFGTIHSEFKVSSNVWCPQRDQENAWHETPHQTRPDRDKAKSARPSGSNVFILASTANLSSLGRADCTLHEFVKSQHRETLEIQPKASNQNFRKLAFARGLISCCHTPYTMP